MLQTPEVCEVVEEGEEDREGLLQAEVAIEGPFAVELGDWEEVRVGAGKALVDGDVLAGVVAFGGAVPEEKAVVEGCGVLVESVLVGKR